MSNKPVEIEFLLKDHVSDGLETMQAKLEAMMKQASGTRERMAVLQTAIGGLTAQLEALERAGSNGFDLDQERNIAEVELLQKKIKELEGQLETLEQATHNTEVTPPDMENAKRQYNGLHMSIQQIAREMPSLAMGPQMFFLAISNNLPVFTDELARARREYDELAASGQRTTPVWRQVLSSLFSWQTGLTTLIMLLVMYGNRFTDWIGSLASADSAQEQAAKSAKKYAESLKAINSQLAQNVANAAASQLASYKKLQREYDELGRDMAAKRQFIDQNKEAFHELGFAVNSVADAEKLLVDNTDAVVAAIMARAKAAAYEQEIRDVMQKSIEQKEANKNSVAGGGYYRRAVPGQRFTSSYGVYAEFGDVPLKAGEDYRETFGYMGGTAATLTDSGAAKLNAHRNYEAAQRLKANNDAIDKITQRTLDSLEKELDKTLSTWENQAEKTGVEQYNSYTEVSDKERENLQQAADKLLALRSQNQQSEIALMEEGRKKKLEQINADYDTQKAAIEKKARELEKANKAAGLGSTLTTEQQKEIDRANELNEKNRTRQIGDLYKEEAAAMREYLKEYGSFQQQKLAIAEEYAQKIRKAQNEGERLTLEKQRDRAMNKAETDRLATQIDWGTVFGEFGGMFRDIVEPALNEAKAYMRTDDFRNADPSDQRALVEAVAQMGQSIGTTGKASFKRLGQEVEVCQRAMERLAEAQEDETKAYANLKEAQEAYAAAQKNGTLDEQEAARLALDTAQANADAASLNVQAGEQAVKQGQQTVSETATRLDANLRNVTEGLQKLSAGGLSSAYTGLIQFGKGAAGMDGVLGEAMGKMSEKLEDVPVVGWILSIVDLLKDGLSNLVGGLLDSVLGAVSGILDDILSGDLFATVGKSLLTGVGNILDAVSFGGFGKLFGNGESDKHLKEDIERLTLSNRDLERALGNLTEKLDKSAVAGAKDVYAAQKANIEAQMRNTQEMMARSGAAYSNGFLGIGGSHSSNKKIDDAMTAADWARISQIVGRAIGSAGDFWGLSSKEMAEVAQEATDLYSKIKDYADNGHANAAQYMDEYIEYYKELDSLQDAYNEKLASVSFDTVRDNFKKALLDMNGDTEAFFDAFTGYAKESVLESMMTKTYDGLLKEWYDSFASSMEDGLLSEDERNKLQGDWERIVNQAAGEWNSWKDAMGWEDEGNSVSQSGKAGSFNAMNQEQGTKLEGLFTAGEMHWSSMDENMEEVSTQMGVAVGHLRRIEEHTGESASTLRELKDIVKQIKRDGLRI